MKSYQCMRLYYYQHSGDKAAVEAERLARASSPAAHAFDFTVNGAPLFVMFVPELMQNISGIYQKSARIARFISVHEIPGIALISLKRNYLIDEIQQTNEVENVRSTHKEIKEGMEIIETGGRSSRFNGMILKYIKLLKFERPSLITCADVRRLYDEFVLDEVLREKPSDVPDGAIFRAEPVYVAGHGSRTVHAGLMPEAKIISAMESALAIFNDPSIDIILRAAVFHYMFAYIHPFYDGNGRMARFISCSMLSEEIDILICLRLSFVIKSHRAQYYRMFRDLNDPHALGDMTRFAIDFAGFVSEAADDVLSNLRTCKQKLDHYCRLLDGLAISDDARALLHILLQGALFGDEWFSMDDLVSIGKTYGTPSSKATISRLFNAVPDLIVSKRQGHRKLFTLSLDALQSASDASQSAPCPPPVQ